MNLGVMMVFLDSIPKGYFSDGYCNGDVEKVQALGYSLFVRALA